jgi:hypothetical protein
MIKKMDMELAQPIWTYVSNSFDGNNKAYIYIWLSKLWQVLYIGQTNDASGTLSRAVSHVQANGTFRQRFENKTGVRLEKAKDLVLISFLLPQENEYLSIESSYREAVEYLVQLEMHDIRGSLEPSYKIISNVRYNDRAAYSATQKIAKQIILDFQDTYNKLNSMV